MIETLVKPKLYEAKVTVELYDALTGKKKEEVCGKNSLMPYGREYLEAMMKEAVRRGMNISTVGYNPNNTVIYPFGYIVLGDDASPINPNQVAINGNIIGYANRQVASGVTTKQGSYNASESFQNKLQTHWVFDFPSNVANGNINEVAWSALFPYWAMTGDSSFNAQPGDAIYKLCFISDAISFASAYAAAGMSSVRSIKRDWINNCYYVLYTDSPGATYLAKLDLSWNFIAKVQLKSSSGYSDTNVNPTDFTLDANNIYLLSNINYRINVYPRSSITWGTTTSISPSSYFSSYNWATSICYCPKDGNLYVGRNSTNTIYVFSTSGTSIKNFNPAGRTDNIYAIDYDSANDVFYVWTDTAGILKYSGDLNTLLSPICKITTNNNVTTNTTSPPNCSGYYDFSADKFYLVAGGASSTLYGVHIGGLGARCVLPSTITKTSANTLKVKYDFNFSE